MTDTDNMTNAFAQAASGNQQTQVSASTPTPSASPASSMQSAFDQAKAAQPPASNTPKFTKTQSPSWGDRLYAKEGSLIPDWVVPEDPETLKWINEHVAQPPVRAAKEVGDIFQKKGLEALALGKAYVNGNWSDISDDPRALRLKFEQENPRISGVAGSVFDTLGNIVGNPTQWPLMGATAAKSALMSAFTKVFGVQMAEGAIEESKNLWDNWDNMSTEQRWKGMTDALTHAGMSWMSLKGHGEEKPKEAKVERVAGEKPTAKTVAGVTVPVSAQHAEAISGEKNMPVEFTGRNLHDIKEFQRTKTAPAATAAMHNVLNQGAEDLINQHDAIVNHEALPERVAGTDTQSKYRTVDDAANALYAKAQSTTYAKADEISEREQQQYRKEVADAVNRAKQEIAEYNQIVTEHNANLGPDDTPMTKETFDPSKIELPERPKTYGELKGAVDRAKMDMNSRDAQVREEAVDNLDKAEKQLDQWFKQHNDEISPEEYTSAKKLIYASSRYQEIANGLRSAIENDNITGNKLRSIIAGMNNRMIKRGEAPGAFRRLVGDDVYRNWIDVARLFDPIRGAPPEERTLGKLAFHFVVHHMLTPLGVPYAAHFLMDRILNVPAWGDWFRGLADGVKERYQQGTELPNKTLETFKALWNNERGTAAAPGMVPLTPEDELRASADRFNGAQGRPPVRQVTPEVNPQGMNIADAYDQMEHNPNDPQVRESYEALKNDVKAQWDHAQAEGFRFEPWKGEGQPYADSRQMRRDVMNNKHLYFFQGGEMPTDHPLAEVDPTTGLTYNDMLRAIHDLYGHAAGGYEFGPKGEEAAYKTHAQMFSPEAIPALTTETRGQNNWVNYGPHMRNAEGRLINKGEIGYLPATQRPFAEQKAGILPPEFHGTQQASASPEQAIADWHNTHRGFTYNPKEGFVRNQPVFSVAGAYPEVDKVLTGDKLTADDIRRYMADPRVREILANDPQASIGGWNYKGNANLEISRLFKDRDEAMAEGQRLNQNSIYDHEHRAQIPTGGNAADLAAGGAKFQSLVQKYGTTSDVLKAGFIGPDGTMVPLVGEHDHMLGAKTTDNAREDFIRDSGAIRTRYRMSKAGEEQVFSMPEEITEDQLTRLRHAAGKKLGRIVLETVDSKAYRVLDSPTPKDVVNALDGLVKIKPQEESPSPVVNNASGESAASQEAINRQASEKSQGIKRVKILRNGQEVPLIVDAADQTAGPGETIVKRYADGHEEIQDQGVGARYNGPKTPTEPPKAAPTSAPAQAPDLSAKEIATRKPTSKKVQFTNAPGQYADMNGIRDASQAVPSRNGKMGYAEKLARTVAGYDGLDYGKDESPRSVMEKFINRMVDNLVALHNAIPAPMRALARRWYDTAHNMAADLAKQHGVSHEQAAGVLAALSPQNAWDNNVALAKRLLDTYKNRQNFEFSPEMEAKTARIKKGQLSKSARGVLRDIQGKTLGELADQTMPEKFRKKWGAEAEDRWANVKAAQQAMWVRLYDEAHNSPQNDMFHPNGDIVGVSPNNRSWIGLDHIAKAIRIINDGSIDNINRVMGEGNKVRNFYNNIINPNSVNGHVTVDTHAVGAAHMQPFSGDDVEVLHNFGNTNKGTPGAPKHAATGMKGTYALYAEAYRRAAEKLGLQPRELQSITWEGIRSLMGDEKKTPELKSFARDVWKKVQERELTPNQARDMIIERAGGFSKPSWMTDEQWDEVMTAFDPHEFAAGAGHD